MRKLLFAHLALCLVAGLVACSGGSNNGSSKVTLTYAMWDQNYQPAIEQAIREFEDAHPNIKVNIELTPWSQYWTKLDTGATGGELPDVFWMNNINYVKYATNGIIAPLDDRMEADQVDASIYPDGVLDYYAYEGKHYGLPFEMSSIGLFYNKKLFDAANLPYPDETWDWDDVRNAAEKLTDPANGVWGIASTMSTEANYYNTIYQNGGYIISEDKMTSGLDRPEAIEGIQFWVDFIAKKQSPSAAQMSETSSEKLFESGKIAMLYDGSWIVKEFADIDYTKENVDVTVLPKGKVSANIVAATAMSLNAKTKHPQEAWELLRYMASKEAALIYSSTGSFITAVNGTQEGWVKSIPFFNLQAFIDSATKFPKAFPTSKDTMKWFTLEEEYMLKAWSQEISVEEMAKQLAQKVNELLAQE